MMIMFTSVSAFAGGALPGFTSAEQPVLGEIHDKDPAIMGSGPAEMTVVVKYKNACGEVTEEVSTDENGIFSVNVEGKLSAADKVSAYTKGLRTFECMADSEPIEVVVLPTRASFEKLKAGSRKITVKTYAKAKIHLTINKFNTILKTDKKGKAVFKLSKKDKVKKGYKVKWTITYKGVKGPTQVRKIK